MARRRLRKFREIVESDLEILPLMNLFVVLIPMLLLSAVFLELSVIHMAAPGGDDEAVPERESLDLAVHITETSWEIRANNLETRVILRTADGGADPGAVQATGHRVETIAFEETRNEANPTESAQDRNSMVSAIDVGTPFGRLQAALIEIVVDYPENKAVRIVSQPETIYEDIIEVMDASRAAGLPEASLQAAGQG